MKRDRISATSIAVVLILGCITGTAVAQQAKPQIVHDAKYYILATHGERCAAEDRQHIHFRY